MSVRLAIRLCCVAALAVICGACAAGSIDEVCGTYVVAYPFGTDTITLNRDGTSIQKVTVAGDPIPEIAVGHWSFDPSNGYVTLDVYLAIDDGYAKLNGNWRTPHRGFAANLPVEKFIFITTMGSKYPYIKQ
jgi:hypothetical protein